QDGDSGIDCRLNQAGNERVFAKNLVEKREQVGIARQAIKRQGLGELAMKDFPSPVVVKMHIAAVWQEKWGFGQVDQIPEAQGKNCREQGMAQPQGEASGGEVRFHPGWH